MERFEQMYLEYVNNFLSVEYFAEWYGITPASAVRIIRLVQRSI